MIRHSILVLLLVFTYTVKAATLYSCWAKFIKHDKAGLILIGFILSFVTCVQQLYGAELFNDSFEVPDIAPSYTTGAPPGWTNTSPGILANVASIEIRSAQPTWLQISEVVATETGTGSDLALASAGATASGSGNYSAVSNPNKTIDGIGPSGYPNIYHSNGTGASEFLRINLASPSTLDSLTIMGRTNCCSNRDVYDVNVYDSGGVLIFSGTDYSANNASHSITINFPSVVGVSGVIDEGSGWLTTPYGEQVVWINSGSVSTTNSNLSAVLTADVTYTLSFNVAKRNDLGGNYKVELLAGTTVLGSVTGTPTQSDFSESGEIVFTASSGHGSLGETLQIRLSTNGTLQPQFDNIRLEADDNKLSVGAEGVSQGYDVGSYGGSQDIAGTVEIRDAGASLYIEGNRWQKIDFPYTVTPGTVIEFDFQSTAQGEIQGLGFDTDLGISSDRTFKLYGTQNWGLSNYATYSGSGVTHFSIPVGQHYTGVFQYLFFVNDDDNNPTGNSLFSNIQVYETTSQLTVATGGVNQGYDVSSYGGSQDIAGTVEIRDTGASLYIEGNRWQKINFPYTVTPSTVIEFDFQSTVQGEIQGLGFDTDLGISSNRTFKLYGTQNWGLSNYATYSGNGVTHFSIPVGQHYTGAFQYLFFVNDDDSNPTGNSLFSNIQVYESAGSLTGKVNIDNQFTAYISTSDNVQGTQIASGTNWTITESLAANLNEGQDYYLHIHAVDVGGVAGFLGEFTLTGGTHQFENGSTSLLTDTSNWRVSTSGWSNYQPASGYGQNGVGPWGFRSGVNANATWIWSSDNNGHNTNYFTTMISASGLIPEIEYTMDANAWNGTTDEVLDTSGNDNHGTAQNSLSTTNDSHLCRAGDFDGVDDYIENAEVYGILKDTASMSFWIKTVQTGNNTGWRAPGVAGVEQSGGSDDIFWGWLDATGRIGLSVANDFSSKSTVAINDNTYHHVVLSRDASSGAYKIYIDGVLNKSGTIGSGVIGTSFSSIGRIEDTGGSPEYFQGKLDELKIYARVLSDAQVTSLYNETRACANSPHHYAISHSTPGLTCEASLVTVTAHDAAHNPINVGSDTNLTITTSPVVDSIISSPAIISNGNSSTTFYLNQSSLLSNIDIDVTDGSATDPDDGGSEDPSIDFLDTAFRFYSDGSSSIPIGTQIAGKPSTTAPGDQALSLRAVRTNTDTGACEAALTGNQAVNIAYECNNPATCTANNLLALTGAGPGSTTITRNNNNAPLSYTPVNLTFDAAGEAPFSFNYNDAGQITLHAEKMVAATSPEPGFTLIGSSNAFVTRPFGFNLDFNDVNAFAVDHNGSAFKTAGTDFTMQVTALGWQAGDDADFDGMPDDVADWFFGNMIVPNFGQELTASTLAIAHTLVLPLTGDSGTFTATTLNVGGVSSSFTNGAAISTVNWDEVGIIDIDVSLNSYLADPVANINTTVSNVGRFYPASFDIDIADATFAPVCNSTFTYLDQSFQFDTAPQVTIKAINSAGDLTQNYEGDFWKLGTNLLEQGTCNALGLTKGFCYTDNVLGATSLIRPNSAQSYGGDLSNVNGEVTLTLHNQSFDLFEYQRPTGTNVAPFDADVQLVIELSDDDAVTGTQTLANIGFLGDPDIGNKNVSNQAFLRHGRWKMENAYGPETQNLAIKSYAQYFLGTRFVLNPDDACTSFTNADLTLNPTGTGASNFDSITVGSGSSDFSMNSPLMAAEDENFRLSSPGAGNLGVVDISVDLSSQPWLQFDWNSDGSLDDHPVIKATFGQYRGHDRIIYWREVNN